MARNSLYKRAKTTGDQVYYEKPFRDMIESHLEWLKKHEQVQNIDIKPNVGLRYEGDFFGLLSHLQIPQYMHWVIMRMNGYTSPAQYTHSLTSIIAIDNRVVNDLKRRMNTLTDVA